MATITLAQPVTGTVVTAGLHAGNYSAIQTAINGGLDNSNLAGGANIAASKIAGFPNDPTKALLGDGTWGQSSAQKVPWGGNLVSSGPAFQTWTANQAVLIPFTIFATQTADRLYFKVNVLSGNYDIGVYDSAGNLKVSKGSTAMSGLTGAVFNEPTFASTSLAPGQYYAALAINNSVGSVLAGVANDGVQRFQFQVAASFPLPATITVGSTHPAAPWLFAAILA